MAQEIASLEDLQDAKIVPLESWRILVAAGVNRSVARTLALEFTKERIAHVVRVKRKPEAIVCALREYEDVTGEDFTTELPQYELAGRLGCSW